MTLVELCAGTASVSLYAIGQVPPIVGFMGSKRRWAARLVEVLGCDQPDRVVLVDAGPWGDVWRVLRAGAGPEVADILDEWGRSGHTPNSLWRDCVASPPSTDPAQRVAQYLWLQARSAGAIPIWWSPERGRWESPSGSRTERAHDRGAVMGRRHRTADIGPACAQGSTARGARGAAAVGKPDHPGARGIQYPETVAARVRAVSAQVDWSRVEVVHGDVRHVAPIPGAAVLFDPPYLGAPRYAALLPRADVLDVAQRWADAGASVAVCEAEALALPGWHASRLPPVRRDRPEVREWLTTSWPVVADPQLSWTSVRGADELRSAK